MNMSEVSAVFDTAEAAQAAQAALIHSMDKEFSALRQMAVDVRLEGTKVILSWHNKPTQKSIMARRLRDLGGVVEAFVEPNWHH